LSETAGAPPQIHPTSVVGAGVELAPDVVVGPLCLLDGKIRLGPGTLYGAIKTLLGAKLISETESRVDLEMNDERRRYYKLSDLGSRVLAAELRNLADVVKLGRTRGVLERALPDPT